MAGMEDVQVDGICAGRRGGEQVQQIEVMQRRAVTDGGGGKTKEGNRSIQKNG